ncbi:MAG: PIN domain-containing protein [Thermoleophilia bacterium]|jgi:predicted nucleic acid-binding protein|nr:PIN domain-containing protein [Thermoleophilia bacterium]
MPRLFAVDTNVIVSGVLRFGRPSATSLVLAALLDGRVPFVISADLLAEYRRVLLRPIIAERHGWVSADIDRLLAELTTAAYLRQPPDDGAADTDDPPPDGPAGDEHVIRLLAHEPRASLVSGDGQLLDAVRGWREVLTPAELVALLGLRHRAFM